MTRHQEATLSDILGRELEKKTTHQDMERLGEEERPQSFAPTSREQRDGNRAQQFVQEISTHALLQLTELRERVDTLISAIQDRQVQLTDEINEHIKFVTTAIKAKVIITNALDEIEKQLSPLPPPTLSHRNGNGNDHN